MDNYCSGKHKCEICGIKYECQGVSYGHTGSKGYRCHGDYIQFCGNHPVNEYIEKHKENDEI